MTQSMRLFFPTRSILLLVGIGVLDLVSTAWLYSKGMITERNPLMRMLLDHGEWLFILVKGATLVAAWGVLAAYSKYNIAFVKRSCLMGSAAYLFLWTVWFCSGGQ